MSFRMVRSRRVLRSRIFAVDEQTWQGPAKTRFQRHTLIHPGAVAIAAFDRAGRLIVIRQFRAAARGMLLEIPAGTLEPGEPPLACAKRELIEETGFAARRWRRLGSLFPVPGYSTEKIVLYRAWDLYPARGEQDHDEHIEPPVFLTAAQARAAVLTGRLRDGKTLSALLLLEWGPKR